MNRMRQAGNPMGHPGTKTDRKEGNKDDKEDNKDDLTSLLFHVIQANSQTTVKVEIFALHFNKLQIFHTKFNLG